MFPVNEASVVVCPFGTVNPPLNVASPVEVSVPEFEKLPVTEVLLAIFTFPVVLPPIVKVWFFVVWSDPAASRTIDPESVAVWEPRESELPRIANLAEALDCPPIKKSSVELSGVRDPLDAGDVQY